MAAVPLIVVSPGQINAQLAVRNRAGTATAVVVTTAGRSAPATFTVRLPRSGHFRYPASDRAIAVTRTGTLNAPDNSGLAWRRTHLLRDGPRRRHAAGSHRPGRAPGHTLACVGDGHRDHRRRPVPGPVRRPHPGLYRPGATQRSRARRTRATGDAVPVVIQAAGRRARRRRCRSGESAALLFCCASAAFAADRYQITLRLPPGGLYAREEMQIEFRVEDTTRPDPLGGFAPVIRAAPEATIDMPEMPKMPKFVETAHPEGVARRVRHPSDLRAWRRIPPAPADPSARRRALREGLPADRAGRRPEAQTRPAALYAGTDRRPQAAEGGRARRVAADRRATGSSDERRRLVLRNRAREADAPDRRAQGSGAVCPRASALGRRRVPACATRSRPAASIGCSPTSRRAARAGRC